MTEKRPFVYSFGEAFVDAFVTARRQMAAAEPAGSATRAAEESLDPHLGTVEPPVERAVAVRAV